jgi:hypothetical protein
MANCIKITYPTPGSAGRAAKLIAAALSSRGKATIPVAIYPCEVCHGWHLTSQKQRPKFAKWNVLEQKPILNNHPGALSD